jgi:hypothetical protein
MKHCSGSFALLITFLCAACASSGSISSAPLPTPLPETTADTVTRKVGTSTSWKITPSFQPQAYSSSLTTIITEIDGSASQRDSLTTQVVYSISTDRSSDSLSFSGSVTSFSIQGEMSELPESQMRFPIHFTGRISNHNVSSQVSDTSMKSSVSCADPSLIPLRTVERNLFTMPLELVSRQTWTDSTTSTVCNGMLPLTVTSIRTFEVVGELELDGSLALVFDQNERTFSKGEGSQGQHRILVETQGVRVGHLYIDRSSGQLLGVNLTSKITLTTQSSGRVQKFLQNSTEITRRTR